MDQLKTFLAVLKRHHFWFIAPILFVVGLIGWMKSTQTLDEEYQKHTGEVQRYVSQMQTVSSKSQHPNEEYKEEMQKLISARRENVRKAWEEKWNRQKEELTWPEELPQKMREIVQTMRPIETVTRRLDSPFRRSYQTFVKDVLPRYAERIGANWNPSTRGGGRGFSGSFDSSGERLPDEASSAIVQWSPEDQGSWLNRFDWGESVPETKELLYAQEDLWVLETLIDIIDRTNGNAVARAQAAVKGIEFIQVGAEVKPPSQVQAGILPIPELRLDEEEESDGDSAAPRATADYSADFGGSEDATSTAQSQTQAVKDYVRNRYYDADYNPIEDEQALLDSASVAKRIPVRMRITMDQREISHLLVECANAPLTFEVRQFRLNPQTGGRGDFSGTTENVFAANNRSQTAQTLDDYESFDRTVELFGIVYIFNPPNEQLLNGEVMPTDRLAEDEF